MRAFETWTHKGVRFLAFPHDHQSVTVIDQNGHHYGTYFDRM